MGRDGCISSYVLTFFDKDPESITEKDINDSPKILINTAEENQINMSDPNSYNNRVKFIEPERHYEPIQLFNLVPFLGPFATRYFHKLPGDDTIEYPLLETAYWVLTLCQEAVKEVHKMYEEKHGTGDLETLFERRTLTYRILIGDLESSIRGKLHGIPHPSIKF
jgi:hypothetical protein